MLLLLASTLVATEYCLLYVNEYGVLRLAVHIAEQLAAACYLLWSSLTKHKTCQGTCHFLNMAKRQFVSKRLVH